MLNRSKRIATDKVSDLDAKNAIRRKEGMVRGHVLPGYDRGAVRGGGFKTSISTRCPQQKGKDKVRVTYYRVLFFDHID
jgi:hypothetical protein